ncbi:phage head-tail connector protein [Mycobacteroides abscessus]|uniref:phage head-tail connector protein n=1 Tax=Mycobacteroides abscessus TaxID=36809 RepID=UPI003F595423
MGALASVDDLQTLMGVTFTQDQRAQAELVLNMVSAWARGYSGQSWPDPASVPEDIPWVVLSAAKRELRNPDRAVSKAKGPFSVSYGRLPDGAFLPAELAILRRYRGGGGLFTVQFGRSDTTIDPFAFGKDGFLEDGSGGDPIPYYRRDEPGWEDSYHF